MVTRCVPNPRRHFIDSVNRYLCEDILFIIKIKIERTFADTAGSCDFIELHFVKPALRKQFRRRL